MLNRFDHGGDIYSRPVALDFSVNLNPLGMPEAVKDALKGQTDRFAAYPDPLCRSLCAALSRHLALPQEQILFGSGAADLIIRLTLAAKPKTVTVCAPTFSEYEKAALLAGAKVNRILLTPEQDFAFSEDCLSQIGGDMFFLCNPNNPTGRLTPPETVEFLADFCEERGILFVLDECFLPFTGAPSSRPLLACHRRMVILDAFTKLYAMAGLRLGYMLCSDAALIAAVRRFGQSWSVSAPAQIAGEAALTCEPEWTQKTIAFTAQERDFMIRQLRGLKLTVWEGAANYILFKSPRPLGEGLLKEGILIRPCGNYTGLDDLYYRVGVKGLAENLRLLSALERVLKDAPRQA